MKQNTLKIVSKKRLFSRLQGEHKSLFGGSGVEFLELREYSVFDNASHINWKRSLDVNAPLVNIFSDDRELNIVVVYLASGSLEFKSKKEVARDVASTLCLSATYFKERLSFLIFSNKEELYLSNLRGLDSYDISYDTLSFIKHLGKEIDYSRLCDFLNAQLKERSLIFLVGDFLDSSINLAKLAFAHEVYAIVIRDKKEESISAVGEGEFKDPVTLKVKRLFIGKSAAKNYNMAFKKQDSKMFKNFDSLGIRYLKVYKSSSIYMQLKELLDAR